MPLIVIYSRCVKKTYIELHGSFSYLYFMPVRILWSLDEGRFCTDSWPRLRATMATARNLLLVLGLLAFCRLSRSSVLRFTTRWSVQTNDTCMAAATSRSESVTREQKEGVKSRGGTPGDESEARTP